MIFHFFSSKFVCSILWLFSQLPCSLLLKQRKRSQTELLNHWQIQRFECYLCLPFHGPLTDVSSGRSGSVQLWCVCVCKSKANTECQATGHKTKASLIVCDKYRTCCSPSLFTFLSEQLLALQQTNKHNWPFIFFRSHNFSSKNLCSMFFPLHFKQSKTACKLGFHSLHNRQNSLRCKFWDFWWFMGNSIRGV